MLVRVLGPIGVVLDDRDVSIASRNQRIVLGVLAASPRTLVGADALIDAIWPDDPPATARASLRTYVSRLRGVVGDAIVGEAGGYRLDAEVDAERFAALVSGAAGLPPDRALQQLDAALGLWRGAPFGSEHPDVLAGRVTALEETYATANELRARSLCELGRCTEAITGAELVLTDHPFREGTWAVLVSSLASTGRKVEALRAAQSARSTLTDAGLEPGELLLEAERAALEHDAASEVGRRAPIPVGSLIGRAADLTAITELLSQHRLVSLVGPGGVGKTRLAVEVAHQLRDTHARGAVIAELVRIEEASSVADAMVDALGLTRRGSAEETLLAASDLDVLLLVDNCEHVVGEVARLVGLLLGAGQGIHLIATTRTRLAVPGEHVFRVEPLTVTGPDAAAVTLFLERVAAAGVPVSEDEHPFVSRIVARLDGLPLAVEMAAARAFGVGLRDLAEAVEEDLSFLRAGHRDASPRHRTLRATIEWSLAGVDAVTRQCLAEMAVFAGPASLDDLAIVLGAESAAEQVLELADRSLVQVSRRHGRALYGLLETVRELGRDSLAEMGATDELHRRHAEHVLARASAATAQLVGPDEAAGDTAFDALVDEIRAAVVWFRRQDPAMAMAILQAVLPWARSRQRGEVYEWASWMLDDLGENENTALLLAFLANQAADAGSLERADELARRAMELSGSTQVARAALEARSDAAIYRGDLAVGAGLAEGLFEVSSALDDRLGMALALSSMALAQEYGGDRAAAIAALDRMPGAVSDPPSATGWIAYSYAEVTAGEEPGPALSKVEQAIRLADSVNNVFLGGVARVTRVSLLARVAEPPVVASDYAEVIEHWRARNDLTHLVTTLRNVAVFLSDQHAHADVVELIAALESGDLPPSYGAEAEALAAAEARALDHLEPEVVQRHRVRGTGRSLEQASARAIDALRSLAAGDQVPTSS